MDWKIIKWMITMWAIGSGLIGLLLAAIEADFTLFVGSTTLYVAGVIANGNLIIKKKEKKSATCTGEEEK